MLLALAATSAPARADELRPGYIEFTQRSAGQWLLVWKSPMNADFTPATQPRLPEGCFIDGPQSRVISGGAAVTRSAVLCRAAVPGHSIGLVNFDAAQSDVLVRVAPLGRPVQALRLTPEEPTALIMEKSDRGQVVLTYFGTGTDHIIFGYDHLLFVVSLVLLLSGFSTIVKAVTAFTVAHSLTLIGTTLGLVGLPQRPVESVIALSIVFLAVEILKRKPDDQRLSERIPWVVAFGFGLLHGFGFAGALKEIGLPESDMPVALLSFNLGVEAGQLVIVGLTSGLLMLIRRHVPGHQGAAVKLATYAIGITASFWFIERTFN